MSLFATGSAFLTRRRYLCAAGALAALVVVAALPAIAQDYPARAVRIIIGFGPGSSGDITARILAQRFNEKLGQQFVVENKPGGGSNLAAEFVARAPKDGHTLLMATTANAINQTLSPNLNFDFAKDLTPVTLVASVPNVLVVHPALGISTVQELIALAKSKPEQIFFGSSGVGTSTHLSGELFNQMAGVKLVHVPYPGSAQAIGDVLTGRIGLLFSPASTVLPHVRDGKLKALATTGAKRTAIAPELPTMSEAGLPGYETDLWLALLAPAGTPRPVIDTLSRAVNEALQVDAVVAPLRAQGIDPVGGTPEEFGRYIEAEIRKWADVATAAGVRK
ncbi:MAG TPA: tripartite tricarboxylate transporter substrate binding protein [Xanthobacteraceae bacterium]|jgi:tripartite-type tricarboxylate transporter receptor subunit TctC